MEGPWGDGVDYGYVPEQTKLSPLSSADAVEYADHAMVAWPRYLDGRANDPAFLRQVLTEEQARRLKSIDRFLHLVALAASGARYPS